MRKKILYICDYSSIYSGNFIKSLLKLREKLKEENIECKFAFPIQSKTREWIGMFPKNEITFIDIHGGKIKSIKEIYSIIKECNPSIVHSHFCSPNFFKPLTFLFPSVLFVVHEHSDFSSGRTSIKRNIKDYITYKFLTSRMTFICVSKEFVKKNPKRAVYVPNGIVMPEGCKPSCNIRRCLGIDEKDILCEIFGWSPYVKGVDIAVESVRRVNEILNSTVKLAIVYGKNTKEKEIKEYINNNTTCTGNEKFLAYLPPTENVFDYHLASDIHISSSRSEGFSYSILEMLSLGKRCVVSEIPGTLWSNKYESVVTFKSENIEECTEAIISSINKNSYYHNVEKQVQEDYSINNWVNKIFKVYEVQ